MREQISSSLTSIVKYGIVPFMALGGVIITVGVVTNVSDVPAVVLVFMVVPLLAFMSLWRCQRVIATDLGLLVGSSERSIQYNEIKEVWAFSLSNPELVTMRLSSGERVRFLAHTRFRFGFGEPPIVGELRQRAGLR